MGFQFKSYVFTSSEFRYDSLENETWIYLSENLRYFLEAEYINSIQPKHAGELFVVS